MDKLNSFVEKNRPLVETYLTQFIERKIAEDKSDIFYFKDFLKKLTPFALNGKMLRGLLVIFSAEMYGTKANETTISAGSAIELIHSGLLIQDDIIDKDSLRRGKKTIYAQYEDEGKEKNLKDSFFYGQSMGLCAGDISLLLAIEILSKNSKPEIIADVASEVETVAASEMLDFHFGELPSDPTDEEILNLYKNKSARYTFSLPLKVGAKIANASDGQIKILEEWGEKVGVIFQIKDDEIGLLGDEEKIGKPVGSDIRQNKKTIFRTLLYQKADDSQKEAFDKIFGNENLTTSEIEAVKNLISDLKIKDATDSLINNLAAESRELLKKLEIDEYYKEVLAELIDYNLKRTV